MKTARQQKTRQGRQEKQRHLRTPPRTQNGNKTTLLVVNPFVKRKLIIFVSSGCAAPKGLTAVNQGLSLRDVGRGGPNARGLDEALFLDPLDAILATGETQADRWLQRFDRIWHGDARMMLREAAI